MRSLLSTLSMSKSTSTSLSSQNSSWFSFVIVLSTSDGGNISLMKPMVKLPKRLNKVQVV